MRIGITGSHSTGKTTLLNALRSEKIFQDYNICEEVTRWVKSLNIEINEGGSDRSQDLIMLKHIHNVFMYDNMLTDRISLDGLVYSKYLYENKKISLDCYNRVGEIHNRIMEKKMYDYIFFLHPDFNLVKDGVRSENEQFRTDIHNLFLETIKQFQLPVHHISGSIRERVDKVLEKINDK